MDGEAKFWLCVIALMMLSIAGGKTFELYEKTHVLKCECPEAAK